MFHCKSKHWFVERFARKDKVSQRIAVQAYTELAHKQCSRTAADFAVVFISFSFWVALKPGQPKTGELTKQTKTNSNNGLKI